MAGATTALLGGAVAAPILGGILGNSAAQGDRDKANQAAQSALDRINAIGAPPDLSKRIILEEFHNAGILTPQLEQQVNLGFSQVAGIQEDPSLKQAQMGALNLLQQRGRTGLGPEDRAALNQVRNEVQRDTEAKRQQIVQQMQQRGMGGSGAEIMSQLQAAQGGANDASTQGDRLAAIASQNALSAITQGGNLAGNIRGQDFDVNKAKAQAADEFKRFDVQNQIARQQRNVQSQNQAQEYNLNNQQSIANANTGMRNQESLRQSQAQRDFWNDKLRQATGQAEQYNNMANRYDNSAGRTAQMWSGVGSGIGSGFGTVAAYNALGNKTTAPANNPNSYADVDQDRLKKFASTT